MEARIKERYNQEILAEVAASYALAVDALTPLDGFESFIYEYQKDRQAYILRVSHSLRRSPDLIRGEVDFINMLAVGGVRAARAVESAGGVLVEVVDDRQGGQFLATAFEKAPGGPLKAEDWTPELYVHYGQQIGAMHRLAQGYQPTDSAWRRPDWDAVSDLDVAAWLPESEARVLARYNELKAYLDRLPRAREHYGIIHQDAHRSNLFVDEQGQITFFDFDDCVYGWFAYDVAIVLFYALVGHQDMAGFGHEFMRHFLRGYRQEMEISPYWLAQIPYFLKLREIDLYAVIHRSFDVEHIEHPWVAMYMDGRKALLEGGVPFVELDWLSL